MQRRPRTVIRPGSPGPAPTSQTTPVPGPAAFPAGPGEGRPCGCRSDTSTTHGLAGRVSRSSLMRGLARLGPRPIQDRPAAGGDHPPGEAAPKADRVTRVAGEFVGQDDGAVQAGEHRPEVK